MKSPGVIGAVAESEDFLGPFTASLKAALDLPFFKAEKTEQPEKIAVAGAIIAEKNELKTEGYSLDLREDAFEPSPFSFKDSLVSFVPEKIGNRKITLYGEKKDLHNNWKYFEKTLKERMTDQDKKDFNDFIDYLNEFLEIERKASYRFSLRG